MRINPHSLRAWRTERGLTRSDLAAVTGTTQPHISRLENGEREPSWALLVRLGAVLAVDPLALVGPDDTPTESNWPHARGRRKVAA